MQEDPLCVLYKGFLLLFKFLLVNLSQSKTVIQGLWSSTIKKKPLKEKGCVE